MMSEGKPGAAEISRHAEQLLAPVPRAHETHGFFRVAAQVRFYGVVVKFNVELPAQVFIKRSVDYGRYIFDVDVQGEEFVMDGDPLSAESKGLQ